VNISQPKLRSQKFDDDDDNNNNIKIIDNVEYVSTRYARNLFVNTVELHLPGSWSSQSQIKRIGLALRVNLSRILQN